jgi:hypothetical protein
MENKLNVQKLGYEVEEPEFLKFYNCHLEMIK